MSSECNTSAQDFQVQAFAKLQADLEQYTPSCEDSEQLRDFLREQFLRESAGLSTVHFSPSSSVISRVLTKDEVVYSWDTSDGEHFGSVEGATGEVVCNRYIALRERENGPVITTYVPFKSTRAIAKDAKLTWRDGGYLVTVKRAGVRPTQDSDQSDLVLKSPPVKQKIERGGNDTSPLPVFSRSSRRRFMRQLASVRVDASPIFITLTYPDQFPESPKRWKRDLDVFGKRFERKFGAGFAWRMELKRRQSGENEGKIAPHFHLLTWGCSFSDLKEWTGQNWYEVVGPGDEKHLRAGTRVERVRSVRGVMWYASKYLAKVEKDDLTDCPNVGRLWGFVNRDAIPWADLLEEAITDGDAVKLLRWVRRCAHIPGRDYQSLTIFGDGRQWLRCAKMLC